ncbi:nose resistant to fluoxetine protein 6-like [Mytilus galloprovincialis]|uniref:nose resistant to fluoxetine protein 6-like n=1 Tax=Mytilus galloprovincialis TaxID=29158 RepID=UPI003F7BF603
MQSSIIYILLLIANVLCLENENDYNDMFNEINYSKLRVNLIKNRPDEFVNIVKSVGTISDINNVLRKIKTDSIKHGQSYNSYISSEKNNDLLEVTSESPPTVQISEVCLNHSAAVDEGYEQQVPWALSIIDAAGKPSSNILGGSTKWLGAYDECLAVTTAQPVNGITYNFKGQYCTASLSITGDMAKYIRRITVGICVPNSCNEADVKYLINTANNTFKASSIECQEPDKPLDDRAIIVLVVVCLFIAVMVLGTLYDIVFIQRPKWETEDQMASSEYEVKYSKKGEKASLLDNADSKIVHEPGLIGKILLSFSVYTNGASILRTEQSKDTITCINGIRFISMTWVCLGHGYLSSFSIADNIATALPKYKERISFSIITNSFVSVDSFFTLSGLLLTYLVMKNLKKTEGKINWGMFYFHRFWRLTPPYMLILMVYVSLFPYIGSGPLWEKDGPEPNYCKDAWYYNILYINNLVDDPKKQCMVWTWYLANDMQFFILSPLILLPLFYSHLAGVGVLLVFLLGTWISTGVVSSYYEIPAGGFAQTEHRSKIYDRPYARMGPYLVGMYTGYLLYKTGCKWRVNKWLNLILWAVFAALACLILYGLHGDDNGSVTLSNEVAALYNTVHRTIWGVCISWVIFSCATGNGGFINTILSWKAFVPLSRLTYMAYMTHMIVQSYFRLTKQRLVFLNDMETIYEFLGHICLTFAVSFVLSLAFELPMMGLEKIIFKREPRKR